MIKIDVISDYPEWKKRIKKIDFFFNKVIKLFPKKYQSKKKNNFLTLLLSNNKNIKKLNFKFRNKNKATDILSFPINKKINNKFYFGDIIISYQFINKPKNINNLMFKKKVIKMFIHGFLHLIGYDHKKDKDYKKMHREEVKIFNLIEKKFEQII